MLKTVLITWLILVAFVILAYDGGLAVKAIAKRWLAAFVWRSKPS